MNIRDLQYVVAIAEEQHFGKAADRCYVSQPALSGQVRKLEESLGVQLFERTNRTVQVTAVGLQIVEHARQLLKISEDILTIAQASRSPFSGHLRLGMISTIGPYLAPLILTAMGDAMPDLKVTLVEGFTQALEKQVASGTLDAAVIATAPLEPQLTGHELYEEPFWIALSSSHRLAQKKVIGIDQLKDENLLLLADGHCLRDQVMDVCHRRTGNDKIDTLQTSLETLLSLVSSGKGLTLTPALTLSGLDRRDGNLTVRPEASGRAGRVVKLVYRRTFPRIELLKKLSEVICNQVPLDLVKRLF